MPCKTLVILWCVISPTCWATQTQYFGAESTTDSSSYFGCSTRMEAEDADMFVNSPCTTPKKGPEEFVGGTYGEKGLPGSGAGAEGFVSGLL